MHPESAQETAKAQLNIENEINPPKPKTWDEQIAPQLARAEQQRQQAEAAEAAKQAKIAEETRRQAQHEVVVAQAVLEQPSQSAAVQEQAELLGSIGYALPYGNCVDEPGVNNPFDGTNPISWPVLSETPSIGATVLFTYNHTGVVSGIWSNGDIEVRHRNFQGNQTRFPRSAFRGFR